MEHHRIGLSDAIVHVVMTDRSDGSFALDEPTEVLVERRSALSDRPWLALRQVHGTAVVDADAGLPLDPPEADAAVLTTSGSAVSVLTADCAPLVLVSSVGVAVVHAGWKGALAGVVDAAASALLERGGEPVTTLLGPCIQPAAYEFGDADLAAIADVFVPDVVGSTSSGAPALDLPRVIGLACIRGGWPGPRSAPCTSDDRFFSHRTRRDPGRQATVAWIEGPPGQAAGE